MKFLKTSIFCPNGIAYNRGDCTGCLDAHKEDGIWRFKCNECGQEAGRGVEEETPEEENQ